MYQRKEAAQAEKDEAEAPARSRAEEAAAEDAAMERRLESVEHVDGDTLDALCDLVQARLGVNAVYIVRKEPSEGPDATAGAAGEDGAEEEEEEEGEEGGAASQLRYVGASGSAQALKAKFVVQPAGITFDAWKLPKKEGDEEEEEEEEDGEPKPKRQPPPPPVLPVVHVRNVLREPRLRFHDLPRLGEYVAAPLRYASLDHPGCIPPEPEKEEGEEEEAADADADAADEGEDEDGEGGEDGEGADGAAEGEDAAPAPEDEPVPPGVPVSRDLAICFDTLGQDRRVGAADISTAKRWADKLKAALERTEQAAYEAEFRANKAAVAAEAAAVAEVEEGKEEDAAAAAETKAAALEEAGGEAAPEDVQALLGAEERAAVALAGLQRAQSRLEGIAARLVPPGEGAVTALHTALRYTGASEESLGDAGARVKTRPHWPAVAAATASGLVDKLKEWNASEAASAGTAPDSDAVLAALEGVDSDAVKGASVALFLVLEWCRAAAEAVAAAKQKQAREEEEQRAAAEAAAAAAAEGAEGAAEGEGEDGEDDE